MDEYHKKFGANRTVTINGSASDFSNLALSGLVNVITEVNGLSLEFKGDKIGIDKSNKEEMDIGGVTFSIAELELGVGMQRRGSTALNWVWA